VNRGEFIGLNEFVKGDLVDTIDGAFCVLDAESSVAASCVHNLEIAGQHVYRIGEHGSLVHNNGGCDEAGEFVYVHLDEVGEVNYIGITNDLNRRAGSHRLDPDKTGVSMGAITGKLTHDQARTLEGMLIRQRLSEAQAKGLISGFEPIAEQLGKAGLLNKNRGRDASRWLENVDPTDFLQKIEELISITTSS
jgi:hypothetical protein